MSRKRVVITGVGMLTPIGKTARETWENALQGVNGIDTLTRVDGEKFTVTNFGELKDFNIEDYIDKKEARKMDRFTQYAIVAADEAVADSGLEITEENAERVGVWIGSGIGGIQALEDGFTVLDRKGPRRVSPFFVPMMIPDMASGQVSIRHGAKGPNGATVTACATGTNSIGDAYKIIERGDAEVMITGGTEAPITNMGIAGFQASRALSLEKDKNYASRPFDKNRDGFVMGEGAGILVIEEYEHAVKRGAHIYAEIVGYGMTADAHHITAPAENGEGGQRAMKAAMKDAGIEPHELGYINAHGTSTPYNDLYESIAINMVFGEHTEKLLVNSTKSMTGHLLGGTGAMEAIITAYSLEEGRVHPTINVREQDPEIKLNVCKDGAVQAPDLMYAMSNSLGFGGHNASLVFKKYTGE